MLIHGQKEAVPCKIKYTAGSIAARLERKPILSTVGLAFLIAIFTEIMGRHSVLSALGFIFVHPLRFLVNVLIVLLTLSVSFLFKKRRAMLSLISTVWIILGVINFVLLSFRTTPLGMIDFMLIGACLGVINVYFDTVELIFIGIIVLAVLTLIVLMFIKLKPVKPDYKRSAAFVLAVGLLMVVTYRAVSDEDVIQESFSNIAGAYEDFGFAYCFSTGTFDRGIDMPERYSEGRIDRILNRLEPDNSAVVTPNIIMVQLESFFDVKYLNGTEFAEDPIPNFTYLKDNYTSGFLTVPSVGAGTANTEFEVLSEMSLDFFGMGEYPYKTILKEEACESVCTMLKELGYSANAIHNNTGTFYGRNEVYAQLGFDTFASIEYMQNVEYNPIGWAKDMCLVDEIVKALDSNEGQNFVFTISVQGHGKYQRGAGEEDVEGINTEVFDDDDTEAAFEYYVSQISEMDEFIGKLVDTLNGRDEPTILVLYGDHLPNFDIGAEELRNGDIFETEYVTWDNMGLTEQDEDVSAYQLSAKIFGMLGINEGILTKLHQERKENESYLSDLENLEYDMLYGSFFCYGGKNPYKPTELQMGSVPVTVERAEYSNGVITVWGNNFTQWSEIIVDGKNLETQFVDSTTLRAKLDAAEPGQEIAVQQKTNALVVLSVSNSIEIE